MKNLSIFKNSRVIITGHTGFKGSWLTAWLKQLNAKVLGISLDPPTNPSHFKVSKINLNMQDTKMPITFSDITSMTSKYDMSGMVLGDNSNFFTGHIKVII